MPPCTEPAWLQPFLVYVLPAVGALLSAIAAWVASRARSTSAVALSTSQAAATASGLVSLSPEVRGWVRGAPDQRKP